MCVPADRRTLRGGRHDIIYLYFEREDLCQRYANNPDFIYYMSTQCSLKTTPDENDKFKFIRLVESIKEGFVNRYNNWNVELNRMSLTSFFRQMEENDLFPDGIAAEKKWEVSYTQLLYHLGMITFDVIDNNPNIRFF